ncbi:hypothetical protein DNX69_00615 [Rhodopseudomonas palustris]|uniref:Uncharacterized protein n=1 Tax=Rhodopseudomonas palustris TaxID=1076 RepID=A0A323UPK0_RHOPL|nr:hypothetical protein [Rhodopseudomonas palustris]PZA13963.1 hypothetical protein DNX69_00615 [Rhodopseudomonas palustris]
MNEPTCPRCHGTKEVLCYSELADDFEVRTCNTCRPKAPKMIAVDRAIEIIASCRSTTPTGLPEGLCVKADVIRHIREAAR